MSIASPARARASSSSRMRKIEIDWSSERTPERTSSSRIWAEYCQAKQASSPAAALLGEGLLGLDGAVDEAQQQLEQEPGVVLARDRFGAVYDDHFGAGDG